MPLPHPLASADPPPLHRSYLHHHHTGFPILRIDKLDLPVLDRDDALLSLVLATVASAEGADLARDQLLKYGADTIPKRVPSNGAIE